MGGGGVNQGLPMILILKPAVGQSIFFDAWITASVVAQAKKECCDLSVTFDSLLSDIIVWEINSVCTVQGCSSSDRRRQSTRRISCLDVAD